MQVCDKKTFAGEQVGAQPFLMENAEDDPEDGIGTNRLKALPALSDDSPENTTARVPMSAKDLAAFLVRPEDSTDDGRICEGSRGAYENQSFWGTIKAFLWIGVGIVICLALAQLH
jgi:hypothetical protein